MAEAEFTLLDDGLDANALKRGVSSGFALPPGGGTFVHGFNSKVTSVGVAGYFVNKVNFSPMVKGTSIRGACSRALSGGAINFAPMLFGALQGTSVNDIGYLIGLDDDDPHHIVIRKGSIVTGLPSSSVGTNGVLARSTISFEPGTWVHLRLDIITEPNNETLLQAFWSDLEAHPYTSPVWVPVPGISDIVDDVLQVHTGSAPLLDGRAGFAFETRDVTRRGLFKRIECWRQL